MPEPSNQEVQLWERARGGDPAAAEELSQRALTAARAALRRRGAGSGDLEDLAQEAVRSTLAFLERGGEAPRDLSAFLKFRAWGVLSDYRKKMRTTPVESAAPPLADPAGREPSPESQVHRSQLREALADCMGRLKPELRAVVDLRYTSRLEGVEIARRLDLHRNTVNVRVFRALVALRECLARKGYESWELP